MIEFLDDGPVSRHVDQQPITFQTSNGIAHRGAADSKPFSNFHLADSGPRLEFAMLDGCQKLLIGNFPAGLVIGGIWAHEKAPALFCLVFNLTQAC